MNTPAPFQTGDFYLYERNNKFGEEFRLLGVVIQNGIGGLLKQPRLLILAVTDGFKIHSETYLTTTSSLKLQQKMITELQENRNNMSTIYEFPKNHFELENSTTNDIDPYVLYLATPNLERIETKQQLESVLSEHFLPMQEYQYSSILHFYRSLHTPFDSLDTPTLSL